MVLSNDFQPIFSNLNETTRIAVVVALVFIVLSCVPVPPSSTAKEVVIQISRHGHLTNAHLVYTKDGLSGSWTKLTGTNGVYNFTVNDPQGLYSITVAEPEFGYRPKSVQFFHAKFSETKVNRPEHDFIHNCFWLLCFS